MAKRELLAPIQEGYQGSFKRDKVRILDEFIAVTGHHRKHDTRLLGQSGASGDQVSGVNGLRSYYDLVEVGGLLDADCWIMSLCNPKSSRMSRSGDRKDRELRSAESSTGGLGHCSGEIVGVDETLV